MTTYTERATEEFSRIAGEHVEVRNYGDEATIICSEMGMRRIADRLTHISKGYSQNLDAWYITIARGTPTLTPTDAPAIVKRIGEYDPTTRQYPAFVAIDGEPEQLVGSAWSAGGADRLADEFAYNYYIDHHTPEVAAAIAVEMSETESCPACQGAHHVQRCPAIGRLLMRPEGEPCHSDVVAALVGWSESPVAVLA